MTRLEEMTTEIVELIVEKGFDKWLRWETFPSGCAYLHSEVSEAFEAWRDDNKELVGEELADLLIRLLHTFYELELDPGDEFNKKMAKNWGREYQHGRPNV